MDIRLVLAATGGAYLAGSIPFGLIVARLTGGPDPRAIGSGRLGGTNALRALGRRRAAVVATGDVLKGVLPVLLLRAVATESEAATELEVCAALFAVIGATRSIWVGLKGGRGIATGFGTALAIAPLAVAIVAPVFIIAIARTRFVSVGSLAASALFAPALILLRLSSSEGLDVAIGAYALAGPGLVWLAHSDNIARLRTGTERMFDLGALRRD